MEPENSYNFGYTNSVEEAPKEYAQKEFNELPQMVKYVKNVKTAAIVCYVCAGITLLVAIFGLMNGSVLGFIDVIILLVLGLIIHLKKSFIAAVILLIYGIINLILQIIQTGKPGGYLIIVAGAIASVSIWRLEKAWKDYCKTGQLPQ